MEDGAPWARPARDRRVVALLGGALGPLAVVVVALAIIGAVGWGLISRRRGRTAAGSPLATALEWADACCPACLTLAVVDAARSG